MNIEKDLRKSKNEWQFKVYQLIRQIPPGCVITYGGLAKRVNAKHGLAVNARNVGYLRNKLYHLLGYDSDVPLHRIAKKWDAESEWDHPETKKHNKRLRSAEGSWPDPKWLFA